MGKRLQIPGPRSKVLEIHINDIGILDSPILEIFDYQLDDLGFSRSSRPGQYLDDIQVIKRPDFVQVEVRILFQQRPLPASFQIVISCLTTNPRHSRFLCHSNRLRDPHPMSEYILDNYLLSFPMGPFLFPSFPCFLS